MPHTASRYQQDLGFTDGRVLATASDSLIFTGAGSSLTRIAAGDWSVHAAAASTITIATNVTSQILRRTGFFEDTQNAFGSTYGSGLQGFSPNPLNGPGTGIPGSAAPQGRPDTFGAMSTNQEITPRRALKIKGFKLLSFDVIYTISAVNLTTFTTRVDQIQYTNGLAVPAATNLLASAANGLSVVASANAYVTNVVIPNPQYANLVDQVIWVEFTVTTPGGSTFDMRGVDYILEFNYN